MQHFGFPSSIKKLSVQTTKQSANKFMTMMGSILEINLAARTQEVLVF